MQRFVGRAGALAVAGWLAGLPLARGVAAHGAVPPAPPDALTIALGWTFEPLVAVPLAALAIGWLVMVDRIDRAHPASPVPVLRTAAFLGGLAVIAVALMSGIERYDTTLFSIHMIQHLLLMLVAGPLLVFAAPVTQLLRVASPRVRQRVVMPLLHSPVVAAVGHPVVAAVAFTTVLWVSHFSPLFDLALEDRFVHDLEHVLFLGAALLFWWPVAAIDPARVRMGHAARVLYLLVQMPLSSFLAMAVLFTDAPLYHHYATLGAPYGITALADQQLAAGIMWLVSDVIFVTAILAVVGGWMRKDSRDAPAAERRADAQRELLRNRADSLAARKLVEAQAPDGRGDASSSR
ncbi:MAG: cytochrome c oxidase assembly protein [Chloroflexota bacterium]